MKVVVEENEWYPVYSLEKPRRSLSGYEVVYDIPDELYDKYVSVVDEFGRIQVIIKNMREEKK